MQTDFNDFKYFDFHDSYFENVSINGDKLIWNLEWVNVLESCTLNPYNCSMRAGLMRLEFTDYKVEPEDFEINMLADDSFEILAVEKLGEAGNRIKCLFTLTSQKDYVELG